MTGETNLQNVPSFPEIKRMIVPSEGYIFVEADLSQAESRIVAWKADEKKLIEKYEKGEDVHSFTASLIFGKPVRKGDPERAVGKRIAHASNYKMGPKRLVEVVWETAGIEITRSEATRRQNAYFQNFPNITSVYQKGLRRELSDCRRTITNPFGRKRRFWTPWGDELFRQAYSHFAQSTVADVMNLSLIRCWNQLPNFGVRTLAQVHDSLLFEVPNTFDTDGFQRILQEIKVCMSVPVKVAQNSELVIPVEFKWGTDWGHMEEIEIEERSAVK